MPLINKQRSNVSTSDVASVLNYDIVVSGFELESYIYVNFRKNTLENILSPFIPLSLEWIVSLLFFYKDGFGIE